MTSGVDLQIRLSPKFNHPEAFGATDYHLS